MAAQADTTVDSKDPLVRTLKPLGQGGPRYPVDMRESGVSGQVVVTFTVDTLGTVPPGGTMIQRESRTPFGDAVCAYFRRVRFDPLVVDGRRIVVRVVNTPFSFDIVR
jgi:TonB family protein